MENGKLSTGLNVWLWIIFVFNIISAVLSVIAVLGASAIVATLGVSSAYIFICVLSVVLEAGILAAIAMLLFGHKKVGLYILIAVAVLGLVVNIISYVMLGQLTAVNIVKSLVSAVFVPVVTFALAKKDIDSGVVA